MRVIPGLADAAADVTSLSCDIICWHHFPFYVRVVERKIKEQKRLLLISIGILSRGTVASRRCRSRFSKTSCKEAATVLISLESVEVKRTEKIEENIRKSTHIFM